MPLKDVCPMAIGSLLAVDLHKMIGNLRRERMLVTQSATYRARCQISSVSLMYGPHRVAGGRTPSFLEQRPDANKNWVQSRSLAFSLFPLLVYLQKQVITLRLYSISRE